MIRPLYKVAEITIRYRKSKLKPAVEEPPVLSAEDAYQYLLKGFNKHTFAVQEQFVVLYLNQAGYPLGIYKASTGGITGTVADIRLILAVALRIAATALAIAHNHPSGKLKPSKADETLTQKLKESASLMDIKLLDHLIIAPAGEYFSFSDEGLL